MIKKFAKQFLIIEDEKSNLHVPVYTYIKPQMGHQFILHILLSLGRFETELNLILHSNLQDSLQHAKLIGRKNDEASFQLYSNQLLEKFIKEQLIFFPNLYRILDS